MSTDQEKQELIDVLKFTPVNYRVEIWGWGGEIVMGTVDRTIYDYFQDNDLDISEFSHDYEYADDNEIPEDMRPFEPGSWFDCDDICHESGATMDDVSFITVYDEKGNKVWESGLDPGGLEEQGIVAEETEEIYMSELPNGTCVYVGTSSEKGLFAAYDLRLTKPFDHTKFKISYGDYEGWAVMGGIDYDDQEMEDLGEMNTDGKSADFSLYCVGDNE